LGSILALFPDYDPNVSASIWEPYDLRKNPANDKMLQYTDACDGYVRLPNDKTEIYNDNTCFADPPTYVRGGITGTYTKVSV
jgi:hypothetical protein